MEDAAPQRKRNEPLKVPPQLTFEKLADEFMNFISDRYPQPQKLDQIITKLGVDKQDTEIGRERARIYVIEAFRDAIENIDPIRFENIKLHKSDYKNAFLEYLEEHYDILDELEEEAELEYEVEEEEEDNTKGVA